LSALAARTNDKVRRGSAELVFGALSLVGDQLAFLIAVPIRSSLGLARMASHRAESGGLKHGALRTPNTGFTIFKIDYCPLVGDTTCLCSRSHNYNVQRLPMDSFCLQTWTTITGGAGITTITQGANSWLDLQQYDDLVFFVDVKEADSNIQLQYQTAPVANESAFLTMNQPSNIAAGVGVISILGIWAPIPLARYVRWRLYNSTAPQGWGITFRIWLAAYGLV
jgi:hypothetical protein